MFSSTVNDRPAFELHEREIHIWYAWVSSAAEPALAATCQRLLAEDEIHRHAAFVHETARREYLVTRGLVRMALARYLAASPKTLRFRKNQHGRPELVSADGREHPLRFNLSHSGGLIACAITRQREIGIDLESTAGSPIDEEVARRHFAPREFADYCSQPTPALRHARFLEFWTLKEAYLKARGTGLALPLEKFACHWTDPDRVSLTIDPELRDDAATWQLCLRRPAPGFVAAMAVRNGHADPVRIVESFTTLADSFPASPPINSKTLNDQHDQ